MRRKHSKVLLTIQYLLMCVMTTQTSLVGLPNSFTVRHGSMLLTDFRHWNDDYQLAVCSFHFQPTSVSWSCAHRVWVGFSWRRTVVVLRVLDSPILRTVVPGVELQKHTKTEIGL